MKLQSEWDGRLDYWLDVLKKEFYRPLGEIRFDGFISRDMLALDEARAHARAPIAPGEAWGLEYEYLWLFGDFVVPEQAKGHKLALDIAPGNEATLFVDGQAFGTRRHLWTPIPHHYIEDNFLPEALCEPGKRVEVACEAYAGHYYTEGVFCNNGIGPVRPGDYQNPLEGQPRKVLGKSTFGVWNEHAYQLFLDVVALREIMENLSDGSLRAAKIAQGLRQFTLAVDFEQEPQARERDYIKAREILKPLLAAQNGATAPTFYAVGNSHMDIAWLWPIAETIRKTSRTFAQQLRLLERYPDYLFMQSQPLTYEMCKQHDPALYEKVKQAVRDGRWIAEGGMWVEPDTNMPSGESLVRQLLYGMRFFKEEFDVDCEILWLPDTFGYSAALPQILKGFGIKNLVTQKVFWNYNQGECFPYHYFTWQGSDGSEVISYLPTGYTYETSPKTLMQVWEDRAVKDEMDKFLLPFGYGDGGGGPTRDYIEYAARARPGRRAPAAHGPPPAAV